MTISFKDFSRFEDVEITTNRPFPRNLRIFQNPVYRLNMGQLADSHLQQLKASKVELNMDKNVEIPLFSFLLPQDNEFYLLNLSLLV